MNILSNKIFLFYYTSFFLLINGGLITFLTQGTPFAIWRQVLTVISFFILFLSLKHINNKNINKVLKGCFCLVYILLVSSLWSFFFQGYSLTRILYSFWMYIVGFPILLFPILLSKYKRFNPKAFFLFFSYLGVFLSVGLFVDSQTVIFKFINLSINNLEDASEHMQSIYSSRCSFLAETVTTFGVFLSFTVLSSIYLLSVEKKLSKKIFLYFASFVPIVGSWFTGSRQIFLVVLLTFLVGLGTYLRKRKKEFKHFVVASFLIIPVALSYLIPAMVENESLLDRYTGKDSGVSQGDEDRVTQWKKGCEYVMSDASILLLGNGLGSFSTKGIKAGEFKTEHYENTFLMRLADTGVLGVLVILFPIIVILSHLPRKKNIFDRLSVCLIFCYLFTSFISPNGASPSTQYIMFALAGIYIVRNKYNLENERTNKDFNCHCIL